MRMSSWHAKGVLRVTNAIPAADTTRSVVACPSGGCRRAFCRAARDSQGSVITTILLAAKRSQPHDVGGKSLGPTRPSLLLLFVLLNTAKHTPNQPAWPGGIHIVRALFATPCDKRFRRPHMPENP